MKSRLFSIFVAIVILACGGSDPTHKADPEIVCLTLLGCPLPDPVAFNSLSCIEQKRKIGQGLAAVNFCERDEECGVSGLHPGYGCHFHHNKFADTSEVETWIDSYGSGECSEGTTLTALDCDSPSGSLCIGGTCRSSM